MKYSILLISFSLVFINVIPIHGQGNPDNYELVYHQDFSSPQVLSEFDMTDHNAWRIDKMDGNSKLELFEASEYEAVVRSPINIAMINGLVFSDFNLEVKLAQTGKEYGHRDLCLFFGMKDPTNFYYVHLATTPDDHANNIFIVNDAPRTKIASKTSEGTDWGATDLWHAARIERRVSEGTIKVFFDNMDTPVMEASDTHFIFGHIGVGSFDDTGKFDDIKIWAPSLVKSKESFFHD